ncbi:hypothetical protein SAMN05421803_110209 [Nocardiopsis flavescens]|uniref:Short chain dehydrogenase n=1 Tax=Nocardiopsis flavescens TaxID=758803 RepID=A0A1M6MT79_9ACTN|nr:hypothetical protein [Nocardiopsis flavescens]SHJ86718.1 hypothetical protein SAMN05421803_110209 [Nocardiopsis flavescens]
MAVYAAAEGVRAENIPGVDVTVVHPGRIRSEMNERVGRRTRFMADTVPGVRAMVAAVQRRRVRAYVPARPWAPVGLPVKRLPLSAVNRPA